MIASENSLVSSSRLFKKARLLTRPPLARRDGPCPKQCRSSSADPSFKFHPSRLTVHGSDARRKLADYFRIDLADLIVIHDDIDLPFQTIRLKSGGGHGGHKGLISIIDHLGGTDFIRVRFGIGKPARKSMVEGYVLEPFSEEEVKSVSRLIREAAEAVTDIVTSGVQAAMEKHHQKDVTNLIKEV